MRRILIKGAQVLIVLIGVTFFVSVMLDFLPGDPAEIIAGEQAIPGQIAMVREDLRLDEPVIVRYGAWVGNLLTGDLGTSYRTSQPVTEAILQRLPASLQLMVLGQLIALTVAVPAAVFSAYRSKFWLGRLVMPGSMLAISTPVIRLCAWAYLCWCNETWLVSGDRIRSAQCRFGGNPAHADTTRTRHFARARGIVHTTVAV